MTRFQTESLFEADPKPAECGGVVRLAFDGGVDKEFDYLVPDELWPVLIGTRVKAPFGRGNRRQVGFCVGRESFLEKQSENKGKLKAVEAVLDDEPLIDDKLMELARWISGYYVCPLGQVLSAMVPSAVKRGIGLKKERMVYLCKDWRSKAESLRGRKQRRIVEYLEQVEAFEEAAAVAIDRVRDQAECSAAGPVKRLAEKGVVRFSMKTVLKSPPAVPEEFALREAEQVVLNADQESALEQIHRRIESGKFGVTLLYGVTDSGKTEVYIRAIEKVVVQGKGAIVLLPEIALTAQTVERFSERFDRVAVLHSGLTQAQRNAEWRRVKAGQADVIIGARSAVFAPLSNIGLIVVDEEHEPSYKQDTVPRYNGRDVAIKRAQLSDAQCILGSATPSLESLVNAKQKEHFHLARLPGRVMDLQPPLMKLVDLREEYFTKKGVRLISEPLAERLGEVLDRGEQVILLLNRRGYSSFVFCPSCKHSLQCRNCDVTLTFHKGASERKRTTVMGSHIAGGYAVCHYCGAKTLVPERCPLCGTKMIMIGLGSQRLEEELAGKFPQAKAARIDSDAMRNKSYYSVLRDFGQGRIDVLLGTQMLAKGLHFPNVTLVGIISADTSLYVPDFRANERTFQLISQVAGRAGRSEKQGVVYVQTFLPDQPAIRFALENDYAGFVAEELKHRRACGLPPYGRMAVILMRDVDYRKLETASAVMRQRLEEATEQTGVDAVIKGPAPALISRIHRFHRMHIVVRVPTAGDLRRLFDRLRSGPAVRPSVRTAIDVDPVNLL